MDPTRMLEDIIVHCGVPTNMDIDEISQDELSDNQDEQMDYINHFGNELVIQEGEVRLINKCLTGELTLGEYAALTEVQEACENIIDSSQPSTSTAETIVSGSSAEIFNKCLIGAGKVRSKRRKLRPRRTLPDKLQGLMGKANLHYARGEYEVAVKMCLQIIRQFPTAPDPFQMLAVLYENMGEVERSLQFALFAAHLSPNDTDEWIQLAVTSEKQGNLKQAIACYTKVINKNPYNLEMYMKRGELMEKVGERETSLRLHQNVLANLPIQQGHLIVNFAKVLARKLHADKDLVRAKEVMEIAFKKVPQLLSAADLNLMLEILLDLKEYANALDVFMQFCNLEVEALTEENNFQQNSIPFYVVGVTIPEGLQIDLHTKLLIVLIHLKAFHLIDVLLPVIEEHHPDEAGDLYFDIAEALISEARHQEALRLLNPLVQSEKYALAAVWLRQAECLNACGRLEDAMSSYQRVVELAPQHIEARVVLAMLLNHFGRMEDALSILSENAEVQLGLLYEKCTILRNDPNRAEEFLTASQLLLSRHFVHITNRDELYGLIRMRRLEMRKEVIRISRGEPQQDTAAPDFGDGKNIPSVEQEWQLFLDVCSVAYRAEKFPLLQRLAFSAMGSKRFYCHSERGPYLEFLAFLSCLYNRDAYHGYKLARDHLMRNLDRPRMWNTLNMVIQTAGDLRHSRFLMRLLARHPYNSSLMLLHANNCLVAGNYTTASNEYRRIFRNYPSPLAALLLGVTLVQMACQKTIAKKRALMTKALASFRRYQEMRGEDGYQEVHYNVGRTFHQLGLLPAAVYHYKEALKFSSPLLSKYPHLLDLKKEVAFNLYLIYMSTGQTEVARSYIERYIVI